MPTHIFGAVDPADVEDTAGKLCLVARTFLRMVRSVGARIKDLSGHARACERCARATATEVSARPHLVRRVTSESRLVSNSDGLHFEMSAAQQRTGPDECTRREFLRKVGLVSRVKFIVVG